MSFFKRAALPVAIGATAMAAMGVFTPFAAHAGTEPVSVTLSITPDPTIAVGGHVTVTATATNTSSESTTANVGIEDPVSSFSPYLKLTSLSSGRNLGDKLIYTGAVTLAPGQSIHLTLQLTAIAAGTVSLFAYSGSVETSDSTITITS